LRKIGSGVKEAGEKTGFSNQFLKEGFYYREGGGKEPTEGVPFRRGVFGGGLCRSRKKKKKEGVFGGLERHRLIVGGNPPSSSTAHN